MNGDPFAHHPEPLLEAPLVLRIDKSFDGQALDPSETVTLRLEPCPAGLLVELDAPYHADPPPPMPVGATRELWRHEVVELFLVGPSLRYLEVEWGPHGHYWMLSLEGVRNIVQEHTALRYSTTLGANRWQGSALLPWGLLPTPIQRLNAFSIHGTAPERHFSAAFPESGAAKPDFHAIHSFPTVAELRFAQGR